MSKRLQVVFDEREFRELQKAARRRGMTVSDWVRAALRDARSAQPVRERDKKLGAVQAAARHAFPTGDIEEMLGDIERGYTSDER